MNDAVQTRLIECLLWRHDGGCCHAEETGEASDHAEDERYLLGHFIVGVLGVLDKRRHPPRKTAENERGERETECDPHERATERERERR